MKEKEIIETYHKINTNGFEFADTEEFSEVAEYFNASKKYIEQLEDKLNKIQEVVKIIDEMIIDGYQDGFNGYFATGYGSEFGCRAVIIKEKLKEIIGGNDSK